MNNQNRSGSQKSNGFLVFYYRFLLFIVSFVAMFAIVSGIFLLNFYSVKSEKTDAYTGDYEYTLGNNKATKVPASKAMIDGISYISFTKIAELCSFIETGTISEKRYLIYDESEYIEFKVGSSEAEVNGVKVSLSGKTIMIGDDFLVPAEVIDLYIEGLNLVLDKENYKLTVKSDLASATPGDNKNYKYVEFTLKSVQALKNINEFETFGNTPAVEFKTDLSKYEEYMNPQGEHRDKYIRLINSDNPMDKDEAPQKLTNVVNTRKDGRATQQLDEYAAKALEALFIEMKAQGYTDVSVTSAYRPYSYQQQLFNNQVNNYPNLSKEEAKAKAATVVAVPGTSEHQSGLALDMHNLPSALTAFAKEKAFTWLKENAHKFGYILRYAEDKTEITKIIYEPWHYRYVGRYHATKMYESGLSLEEYHETLNINK